MVCLYASVLLPKHEHGCKIGAAFEKQPDVAAAAAKIRAGQDVDVFVDACMHVYTSTNSC